MTRLTAYGIGLGLVALVLAPMFREPPVDSFPLSTYPMFSTRPEDPWVFVPLGVDASGDEHRLSPWLASGSHEVMQAAETVRLAVFESADAASALCREVAARVARDETRVDVREIRIVGLSYDPVDYFVDEQREPKTRYDYARCRVERERGS